jgi:hypothetical protein
MINGYFTYDTIFREADIGKCSYVLFAYILYVHLATPNGSDWSNQ